MYSGFAELLLQRRSDEALWTRAYRFFDEMSEGGDTDSKEVLREEHSNGCTTPIRPPRSKSASGGRRKHCLEVVSSELWRDIRFQSGLSFVQG